MCNHNQAQHGRKRCSQARHTQAPVRYLHSVWNVFVTSELPESLPCCALNKPGSLRGQAVLSKNQSHWCASYVFTLKLRVNSFKAVALCVYHINIIAWGRLRPACQHLILNTNLTQNCSHKIAIWDEVLLFLSIILVKDLILQWWHLCVFVGKPLWQIPPDAHHHTSLPTTELHLQCVHINAHNHERGV